MTDIQPQMRLCLLGDSSSIHLQKWARYFAIRNYEVHCITCAEKRISEVRIHHVGCGFGQIDYFLAIPSVKRIISDIKPDIIHVHYIGGYGLLVLPALFSDIPVLATAWGSDILITPREKFLARQIVKLVLRKARHLIAVSTHLKDAMVQLGANEAKVSVLPIGVDTAVFTPPAERRNNNSVQIISLNNHDPIYNIEQLIYAMKSVVTARKDIKAIVLGSGPETSKLKALTDSLGLDEYITFPGRVPFEELIVLLGQSDVYISTASSAGTPVALLEAMACGTYPIITDIPGHREWIQDGYNGSLIPLGAPGDLASAILQAAEKNAKNKKYASYNRSLIIQKADWQTCMTEAEKIYASIKENV
jgi:glycosyltransferase involved in cell wall biosynthesis